MSHLRTQVDPLLATHAPRVSELIESLDPVHFALRLGFQPGPLQAEFLRGAASKGALCCSRQWGKSTAAAIKAIHHAVSQPNAFVVIMCPALRQSAEFISKARLFLSKPGAPPARCTKFSIEFPNGSRILALPSLEANIRGYSAVTLLFIDEAARVRDDAYEAVLPMLGVSEGAIWLLSTPWGQRGFFYEEWMRGGPGWHRIQGRADHCAHIPKRFLDEQRERRSARWFNQEYMCEFSSGDQVLFPPEILRGLLTDRYPPLRYQQ